MHTLAVVAAGVAVLLVGLSVGWMLGGGAGVALAALAFVPLWLVAAGVNMYMGVRRAGYSVADEAPIFALVFAIPAAAALAAWWQAR
jgi:hypothetical protein